MLATMFIGGKTDLPVKLKKELLYAAIDGFTIQKAHQNRRIAELREILNGDPAQPAATSEPTLRRRRKMSAAARKGIAAAQRAKWAKMRGEIQTGSARHQENDNAKAQDQPRRVEENYRRDQETLETSAGRKGEIGKGGEGPGRSTKSLFRA